MEGAATKSGQNKPCRDRPRARWKGQRGGMMAGLPWGSVEGAGRGMPAEGTVVLNDRVWVPGTRGAPPPQFWPSGSPGLELCSFCQALTVASVAGGVGVGIGGDFYVFSGREPRERWDGFPPPAALHGLRLVARPITATKHAALFICLFLASFPEDLRQLHTRAHESAVSARGGGRLCYQPGQVGLAERS